MTIYRGRPPWTNKAAVVVDDGLVGRERDLVHAVVHSPDGFAWGYGGSGPADLALSILADYFGERQEARVRFTEKGIERAWRFHQSFKWTFVAQWPSDRDWAIDDRQIAAWLKSLGNYDRFECQECRAGLEVATGALAWKVDHFGVFDLGNGRYKADDLVVRCRRAACRAPSPLKVASGYDPVEDSSLGIVIDPSGAMMTVKEESP